MTLLMMTMAIATLAPASADKNEMMFEQCTALVKTDAQKALSMASAWQRQKGGSVLARQCLGLAYVAQERWMPAAAAFELAAQEAEKANDHRRAGLWTQAGDAWLAAGEAQKAKAAFDVALAAKLKPESRGEILLDRAQTNVLLGKLADARLDINTAMEYLTNDAFAYYLSAALALKEGDVARASTDIAKAAALAPNDVDILLQAGTISGTKGDIAAAQDYYRRVATLAPDSPAGRAAEAALAANTGQEETVKVQN